MCIPQLTSLFPDIFTFDQFSSMQYGQIVRSDSVTLPLSPVQAANLALSMTTVEPGHAVPAVCSKHCRNCIKNNNNKASN